MGLIERAFRGSDEMYAKAEAEVSALVAELGPDAPMIMPDTAYFMACVYAYIGKKITIEDYNKACREAVMRYTDVWNDLTQAFRNFFASCNGTRKGKFVKPPKFKSKKNAKDVRSFNITRI